MTAALHCSAHPTAAVLAQCARCGARMCADCFRLYADGRPCCDACAVELEAGPPSRWPFAVAFAGIALAICFAGYRLEGPNPSLGLWMTGAIVAIVVATGIGLSGLFSKRGPPVVLTEREPELEPNPALLDRAAHPYRARFARVARRVVPLSGRATALVMTGAFVLSAVALPLGLGLPHWLEAELVLGAWWLAVGTLLAVLLYTGRRLAEDHRFRVEVPKLGKVGTLDASGCSGGDGCAEGILILLVLAVAAVAAWLLVEIVVPIAVFAVYYFVVKAIGRVARDRHDCTGHAGRALAWGFFWASVYVVPLVTLVGLIHVLVRYRPR